MKVKEDELAKVFQTAASVCVNKGLMAAERAAHFSRSGEICDCVGSFLADRRGIVIFVPFDLFCSHGHRSAVCAGK